MSAQCGTCKWWGGRDAAAPWMHGVDEAMRERFRVCHSPRLPAWEWPPTDADASITDGDGYMVQLITGAEFGCTNWEDGEDE